MAGMVVLVFCDLLVRVLMFALAGIFGVFVRMLMLMSMSMFMRMRVSMLVAVSGIVMLMRMLVLMAMLVFMLMSMFVFVFFAGHFRVLRFGVQETEVWSRKYRQEFQYPLL